MRGWKNGGKDTRRSHVLACLLGINLDEVTQRSLYNKTSLVT